MPSDSGSGCSGSDVQFYTLKRMAVYWADTYDVHVNFVLTFACESDPAKRKWLTAQHPELSVLFSDMAVLAGTRALNWITGKQVLIPTVHIFVAGPVCSDRSRLNPNRAQTVNCVQRPRSGDTP